MDGNIIWLTKRLGLKYVNKDIKVCVLDGPPHRRIRIFFYNNVDVNFGEYANLSLLDNRLYFKKSTKKWGSNKIHKYCYESMLSISRAELVDVLSKNAGKYKLNYDEEKELYYIELKNI